VVYDTNKDEYSENTHSHTRTPTPTQELTSNYNRLGGAQCRKLNDLVCNDYC